MKQIKNDFLEELLKNTSVSIEDIPKTFKGKIKVTINFIFYTAIGFLFSIIAGIPLIIALHLFLTFIELAF